MAHLYFFARPVFLLWAVFLGSSAIGSGNDDSGVAHQIHNVFIYTTKNSCEKCRKVKEELVENDIKYKEIDLSWNPKQHMLIRRQTAHKEPPYIFIGNKFIGGHDELKETLKSQKILPRKTKIDKDRNKDDRS